MMKATLAAILTLLSGVAVAAPTPCSTWAEMKSALTSGQSVILTADLEQGTDTCIEIRNYVDATIDLNGHKITGRTLATGYESRMISIGWNSGAHITLDDTRGGGIVDGLGLVRGGEGGGFLSMDHATASFTLRGGTISNFGTAQRGGAVYSGGGSLRIEAGTITNCTSQKEGGGVYTRGAIEMSGGAIVGCTSRLYGGGVCVAGANMTLSGGEIAYNRSAGDGNGLDLANPLTFVMTGGRVHHNADLDNLSNAEGGGGMVLWEGVTATISGGEICDNTTGGQGGGIRFRGKKLTLAGGTIRGNTALDGGGVAVVVGNGDPAVFAVTGGRLEANTCNRWGGGVYVAGRNELQLNLSGGEIVGNVNTGLQSGSWSGAGGGIHSSGRLTMTGGVVTNNTATGRGAAVFANCTSGQKIAGGIVNGSVDAAEPANCLTVDGGLFDRNPGNLKEGYAATALPNVTPTTYIVGKNVGFTRGSLSSGSLAFNPTERLYKEAGVTLGTGCRVTASGNGYAIVAIHGTILPGFVNEAIAFHGFLTKADGAKLTVNSVVKVDFKLYPSANAGAELLWARRIPVTIDAYSGYYVDITDTAGQSYQAPGGVKPSCDTLRAALARHAQLSPGPLWIAYEPVDAKVATPFPRVPLYFQPFAQRASSATEATVASLTSVETKTLDAADDSTASIDRLVVNTDLVRLDGLVFDVPNSDLALNDGGGAVKIRGLTGLSCSAATNTLGELLADLPATADSDCGRVVRHVVNGAETLMSLYYSKGDATTLPEGSTNVYVWSFGPLEEKK